MNLEITQANVFRSGLLSTSGGDYQSRCVVFTNFEGGIDEVQIQIEFSNDFSDPNGLLHGLTESVQFGFTGTQSNQGVLSVLYKKLLLEWKLTPFGKAYN